MLELINPTKPTAGASWFLIAALSTSDEMLPPGKDLILTTSAGELTHPVQSWHLSLASSLLSCTAPKMKGRRASLNLTL